MIVAIIGRRRQRALVQIIGAQDMGDGHTAFVHRVLPAVTGGGFSLPDHWVWCGSVIRGEDGLYHMFASIWSKAFKFSPNWITNSRVVRAESATAEGPYVLAEEVLPPRAGAWDGKMTHNPTIHRCPRTGTYLLFYTGTTYDRPGPTLDNPFVPDDALFREARANQRIGLATAASARGPWTRRDTPVLEPRPGKFDALMTTNPAPCVLDDGRILLAYKTVPSHKSPMVYGTAWSEAFDAPFGERGDVPALIFDPPLSIEDAYVWREDGSPHRFQMIFKDQEGKVTGEYHGGARAVSDDGRRWRVADAPKAWSRTLRWDDGRVVTQGSLERPQLLLQDVPGRGRVPTHLFAACSDGPGGFQRGTHTWNACIPLRTDLEG